jgi:diadenosine tetraphosphate (Ap4A) HIT family hydrolase
MAGTIGGCMFCNRSEGVLLRMDNLFVQLDDAPIVEGHALIMPESHFPSVADLPGDLAVKFDEVCDRLRRIYLDEYGAFTMFEHGRTGHCVRRNPGERICHHAHLHVLPLPGDLVSRVDVGQRTPFTSWTQVADLAGDIDGYLVASSADGADSYFYPVTRPLPSHYLRTVAAELAGDLALADWEALIGSAHSAPLITAAMERLAPHITSSAVRP